MTIRKRVLLPKTTARPPGQREVLLEKENRELRRTNEEIAETLKKAQSLESTNRELEQFAFVAAHDLKEPLRKVYSFADLLKTDKENLTERQQRYLDQIILSTNRMTRLIEDLLQYSRASILRAQLEPVDLMKVLKDVVDSIEPMVRSAGVRVNFSGLPVVNGNPMELTQLFQNLIVNAVKYRGARDPYVTVDAEREGDRWRVSVRDNGIGIAPEQQMKVFDIFVRAHSHKEYSGTGVGLAICKTIVEKNGGTIGVESAPGRGSRFYFTLPAGGTV